MTQKLNYKLIVPGAQEAVDQLKMEIANELGVNFGRKATAEENGAVGGEITKRLKKIKKGKICLTRKNIFLFPRFPRQ